MAIEDVIGWVGSVLVVVSLMLPSVRRFRWMNFTGSVLATIYNGLFQIWPFFAMNLAIALIDAAWILRIERDARRGRAYQLVPIDASEPYFAHMAHALGEAVDRWYPGFGVSAAPAGRRAFLVLHGEETIGLVVADVDGDVADIALDVVTPRFRDFTPGRFVYTQGGLAQILGVSALRVRPGTTRDPDYFRAVGFQDAGEDLVLGAESRF